jgi:hypothetical protein
MFAEYSDTRFFVAPPSRRHFPVPVPLAGPALLENCHYIVQSSIIKGLTVCREMTCRRAKECPQRS